MEIKEKLLEISRCHSEETKEFLKKGDANADKIFRILKEGSMFSVSRVKIVGSVGGRSCCGQPDFTLVVFLTNQSPPFHTVLADFRRVFIKSGGKNADFIFKPGTEHSLLLLMRDTTAPKDVYLSLELLPAMDLLSEEEAKELLSSKDRREEIQRSRALQLLSRLPDPREKSNFYGSSFADRFVSFVEDQTPFVQHVIRLGKLFNRKVRWDGDERLYGRSMIIQCVAISAGQTEEEDARTDEREESILLAFQMFLNKFIAFDKNMVEVLKCSELNLKGKYQKHVEETCAAGGPIILNPTNPFDNLALNLTGEMKRGFRSHAKRTLRGIHNYIRFGQGKCQDLKEFFGV